MKIKKLLLSVAVMLAAQLSDAGLMAFEAGDCVRLAYGGRSLMTQNSSLDVSAPVVFWTETNTHSQRWILEDAGHDGFYLRNAYSGFYLGGISSTAAGSAVGQISQAYRTSRGTWFFEPVEGEEGLYTVYLGSARSIALAAPAEIEDGTAVKVQTAATTDQNIQWTVEATPAEPNELTAAMRDDMMDKWCDHYYHDANVGHIIGRGGFWGDAEMFEVVLDALETTGDARYAEMFDELYKNFCNRNNTDWSGNDYNDDITWMCIACVRAYLLTGVVEYRTRARQNFDKMLARADAYGDGTLVWKQGSQGTNSCINGPAAVCACYLAIALGQESYYTKAARIYAGERSKLYNINSQGVFNGHVYDSYSTTEHKVSNTWASTYNQGTCLGAAVMLYNHYGTAQYKSDADAIMKWTAANLANSRGIIHVCQTVTGDLTGFKGILMRYVRRYAADLDHPEYYEWLAKNAYHAWNNRNSKGISMSAWLHKTTEDFNYSDGGSFNTDGVGAFTALSAAFNAHLGVQNSRSAYETIEAEKFNYLNGVTLQEGDDVDGTPAMGIFRGGRYVGFKRVDFGAQPASHILLRLKARRLVGRIQVYADAPSKGTLLCSLNLSETGERNVWKTVEKELATPIAGVHDIYVVGVYNSTDVDLADLNWITFEARNTLYADLTNMGPLPTTSMTCDGDIERLIDDSLMTDVAFTLTGDAEPWIQYEAPAPIRLKAYSIASALTAGADPTGWMLQGSDDGEEWTTLDTRSDTVFSARTKRILTELPAEVSYTRYRLLFTGLQSATQLRLGEWQLLGQCVSPTDITADGGTLTEGMEPLTDKDATTTVDIAQSQAITYMSTGNNLAEAYSLTVAAVPSAPLSWELSGSNNGILWAKIDEQTNQSFPFDGATSAYRLKGNVPYIYYRLTFTGEAAAQISEWQLLGHLDFGTFMPDLTRVARITSSDGSDAAGLIDDDGNTYATLAGENPKWSMEFPMEVRLVGYSLVAADDASLNPKSVAVMGVQDDASTSLSSRSLTFASRGSRITNALSTSKMFRQIDFEVRSTAGDADKAQLAELELYGTAFAEEGSKVFPPVESVTATAEALSVSDGIEKLTDRVRTTKYRASFSDTVSITMTYAQPQTIDTYALTAAKDEPLRDPKAWKLYGSNDGQTWELLDERRDESFLYRFVTNFYAIAEPKPYTTYRLEISATAGADQLQLCQWQLLTLDGVTALARVEGQAGASIVCRHSKLEVTSAQATTVRIYDVQGRLLQVAPVAAGQTTVPLSLTSAGIYVAVMQQGRRNVWRRFSFKR